MKALWSGGSGASGSRSWRARYYSPSLQPLCPSDHKSMILNPKQYEGNDSDMHILTKQVSGCVYIDAIQDSDHI